MLVSRRWSLGNNYHEFSRLANGMGFAGSAVLLISLFLFVISLLLCSQLARTFPLSLRSRRLKGNEREVERGKRYN